MTNLFSVFEPTSLFSLPINWASSVIVLLFLFSMYWKSFSKSFFLLLETKNYLISEFKAVFSSWASSSGVLIPCCLLFTIFLNNFLGLFPYIFTSSSHLTFTVSMALPLWIGHMFMGWLKTPQNMLAHLVPLGTPVALMPFMVIIELISNVIRPLTLSVRLAANMVAGHLLLSLLGNSGASSGISVVFVVIIALVLLGLLELGVSLIQAYVFSILSTLYFNEVEHPHLN